MQRRPGGLSLVAAALAVIGGIAAAIGSLLSWAEASVGPSSFAAKGIDGWEGKVTIVGGALLLVGGIAAFVGATGGLGRLRTSAFVGGLAAAGVGVYTAVTSKSQIVDAGASEIAKGTGVPIDQARVTVELAFDQGVIDLTLQVGLYLVIVGGVLGIVAGIMLLVSSRDAPPRRASAGLRGWDAPAGAGGPVPPVALVEEVGAPRPGDAPLVSSVWAVPEPAERKPTDAAPSDGRADEDPWDRDARDEVARDQDPPADAPPGAN